MAKIVSHLEKEKPERIDEFKKEASTAVKKILPNFKDLQFFMGESMDPEGMHVIVNYKGATPYMYFFKDGLIEEKVVGLQCCQYMAVYLRLSFLQ